MSSTIPFLWFASGASEAAEYYQSVFPTCRVEKVWAEGPGGVNAGPGPFMVEFVIDDLRFMAMNGGTNYEFTPSVSFFHTCASQEEADTIYNKLAADGQEIQCGWVTDRYGVVWQIVPPGLVDLVFDSDPERSKRATAAMMQQKRLDVNAIRAAADGVGGP